MKMQTRFLPLLALAIAALLLALWAGLLRIGWTLPSFPNLSIAHGPLMVSGFLGVLIPLERAVAIRQRWMFAVPVIAALGWMGLFILPFVGGILSTLASIGALMILLVMVQREPRLHTVTMFAGMAAWVLGNLLWTVGIPIFKVVYLWMAFLVLTIAGERLELSRVLNPSGRQVRLFSAIVAALVAGSVISLVNLHWGTRLNGCSLLALALWFLNNDIAVRNIRHPNPLTRYIAWCLFIGFLWLAVGGAFGLYFGALYAGPYYDAALHAVFVGFVISMIFGHAPIIFPAILGVPVLYRRMFYFHLVLLHLSLVIRIFGDLMSQTEIRRLGGLFNEIAILLFLGMTVYSIVKGRN